MFRLRRSSRSNHRPLATKPWEVLRQRGCKNKEWKKQWRRKEQYPQANELQEREQTSWRVSWKIAQNGAEWIETDGLSGDRTIFQTPGGKLWTGRPTWEAGDLENRLKISCCLFQVLLVKPAVQNICLLQCSALAYFWEWKHATKSLETRCRTATLILILGL